VQLLFSPAGDGRCRTRVLRDDGVVLEMRSYSRKHRVPHDLAHAAVERELRLCAGVFGCVAAGAVFSSMRVLAGVPRHDAAARSSRVIKAHARSIALAEVLSGVVHQAVEDPAAHSLFQRAREGWGIVEEGPFPYAPAAVAAAAETLRALADRWSTLAVGAELALAWPRDLAAPVPAARRRAVR
jgi:hypothetical protein